MAPFSLGIRHHNMLQTIREKATGIIGVIIIVLISLTFALWGVESYLTGPTNVPAATVNNQEIDAQDFQRRLSEQRQRLAAQGIDVSFLDDPVRRREFLESMIDTEVWRQAADDAGLEVAPAQLRQQIQSAPLFQVNGQFDIDIYRQWLAMRGMSAQQLESELRTDGLVQQIPQVLQRTAIVTDAEIQRLARLQNQQRTFDYVVVQAADFIDQVEVTEAEIEAYYNDNLSSFREPEKVAIEYLELSSSDYASTIEPDEATLQARYEDARERFRVAERRRAAHILLEVPEDATEEQVAAIEAEAAALAEQARGEADFAALAREHSDDIGSAQDGGDLGWVSRGDMVEPFEEALFAMAEGAVSEPVRSSFGYHVIKLETVEPERGKTFDEAREELAAEYAETEAERQFIDVLDELEQQLNYSDAPDMEATAEQFGLELKTAGPFPRSGGEEIAARREVAEAAFSDTVLIDGLVSDPIILDDNHAVFLRVTDHQEATTRPLEEVREQVVTTLRQQQATEAARERAETLLAQVRTGATLEEIVAATEGLEVQHAESVGRSGSAHNFQLVREVFKLPRPADGPAAHLVPFADTQFAVVTLESVQPGTLAEEEAARNALAARIERSYAAAEVGALGEQLRQQAEITVNESVLSTAR